MARLLRITVPVLFGLIAFAAAYAWQVAPTWAADALRDAIAERAGRRGLDIAMGGVWVDLAERVVLTDVVVRDRAMPEPPLAAIARVDIEFELDGVTQPKVFLQRIAVREPRLHLRRDASGRLNVQAVIDRLLRPKADDDGPGSGWREYLSRHVPPITLRGTTVAIDDEVGAPLRWGRVDARHLRLHSGAIDITNASAVQEKLRLQAVASVRVDGIGQPIRIDGELSWPEKRGEISVALPTDVSIAVGDWRVRVSRLSLRSDGEAALSGVRIVRTGDGSQFGLDVREIAARVSREAGREIELPAEIAARVPAPARQAIRHITEVIIRDPVIVARRSPGAPAEEVEGDDDERPEIAVEPEPVAPKGKGAKGGKTAAKGADAARDAPRKADPGDGSAVRTWLSELFGKGADRLQREVDKLRGAVAAVPVPLVVVEHGTARFDHEQAGQGREWSDFSARVERKAGSDVVTGELAFHVPGRQARNQVSGKFDVKTGDGEVRVQLDDLPLQPYAAVLPRGWVTADRSAIQQLSVAVLVNAPAGRLTVEGKGTVVDVSVDSPRLSRQRIAHMTATASGRLDLDLNSQRIELAGGRIEVGRVQVELAGSIDKFRTAPVFKAHLAVPTVPCQEVVAAMPQGFADTLAGMRCEGRLSYELKGSLDTANMDSLVFELKPMLGEVRVATLGDQVDFSRFDAEFVHQAVRYRSKPKPGEPTFDVVRFKTGPGSENWVPYDQVSPKFIDVITTTEDGGFFGHSGFLTEAIRSAAIANLKKGRFVRGASTITQQLIKNLFFPQREKTISRKIQEAVVTWYAENSTVLGATKAERKRRMMELYLNVIELGPAWMDDTTRSLTGVYGIGAASWKYFSRPPGQLTWLQALWLGSIIPSPSGWFHEFLAGKATDSHRSMLCWVADVMVKRNKMTADERARLGDCNVVFGGAPDGSEEPAPTGLGHDGDLGLDEELQGLPAPNAPAVDPNQAP